MPSQLKPFIKTDFSGGLDVTSSPYNLGPTRLLRADNFILDQTGALRVRDGMTQVDLAPDDTQSILTFQSLVKEDGSIVPMAIRRSLTGQHTLERRPLSGTGWMALGTFDTTYETPELIPFEGNMIAVAGYEPPKISDGTTFTPMLVLPGAKWMISHQNSLWAWNTAAITSTYDGPSSIRQSDVENPNSWPTSNQNFIARRDGQEGMGLAVFTIAEAGIAPSSVLIAFKNFSTYQLDGAYGEGNAPTIKQLKTDMGCVAGRTIQFCANYGIVRLTHRGFAVYNGLNDIVMSDTIRPYIFGHDDIQGLTWNQIRLSTAAQVQNPPLYFCLCPAGSSGALTRLFVFDLVARQWTVGTFPVPLATANIILEPPTQPYVLAGESGGKRVFRLFENALVDDGAAIAWRLRFGPQGAPGQRIYTRGLALQVFPVTAGQVFTFHFVLGPIAQRGQQVMTRKVRVGASSHPSSPLADSVEAEVYCDLGRTGEVLWSEVSGSGYVGIRGARWDVRTYPRVRPMRS